jgi:hypothetical protein
LIGGIKTINSKTRNKVIPSLRVGKVTKKKNIL